MQHEQALFAAASPYAATLGVGKPRPSSADPRRRRPNSAGSRQPQATLLPYAQDPRVPVSARSRSRYDPQRQVSEDPSGSHGTHLEVLRNLQRAQRASEPSEEQTRSPERQPPSSKNQNALRGWSEHDPVPMVPDSVTQSPVSSCSISASRLALHAQDQLLSELVKVNTARAQLELEVDALREENGRLAADLDSRPPAETAQKLKELEEQVSELLSEVEKRKQEHQQTLLNLNSLLTERIDLQRRMDQTQSAHEQTVNDLRAQIEGLQEQIHSSESRAAAAEAEMAQERERCRSEIAAAQSSMREVNELKMAMERRLLHEIEQLQGRLDGEGSTKRQENESFLVGELKTVKEELGQVEETIAARDRELDVLGRVFAHFEECVQRALSSNEDSPAGKEEDPRDVLSRLLPSTGASGQNFEPTERVLGAVRCATRATRAVGSHLRTLRVQAQESEAAKTVELNGIIAQLSSQVESLQQTNKDVMDTNAQLRSQLSDSSADLQSQLSAAQEQAESLRQAHEALTASSVAQTQSLQSNLSESADKIASLERANEQLQQTVKDLESKIQLQTDQMETLAKSQETRTSQSDERVRDLEAATRSRDELLQQLESARKDADAARAELARLEVEKSELEEDFAELDREMTSLEQQLGRYDDTKAERAWFEIVGRNLNEEVKFFVGLLQDAVDQGFSSERISAVKAFMSQILRPSKKEDFFSPPAPTVLESKIGAFVSAHPEFSSAIIPMRNSTGSDDSQQTPPITYSFFGKELGCRYYRHNIYIREGTSWRELFDFLSRRSFANSSSGGEPADSS